MNESSLLIVLSVINESRVFSPYFHYKSQASYVFIALFTEGQRKANFEECDAKKRESCEKITNLKKDIKILQIKFAKAKNVNKTFFLSKNSTFWLTRDIFFSKKNEDAADRIAQTSRESSACVRKQGLEAAICRVDEDNIRLRRKLDLVKYQSDKVYFSITRQRSFEFFLRSHVCSKYRKKTFFLHFSWKLILN